MDQSSIQERVADSWDQCLRKYAACLVYDRFEPNARQLGHDSPGFLHGVSLGPDYRWYYPPSPPKGHHHRYVVEGYDDLIGLEKELFAFTGKDMSTLTYGTFDSPDWRNRRTAVRPQSTSDINN